VQDKLLEDTPKVAAKASMLGGQGKTKKTGSMSTGLTGAPEMSYRREKGEADLQGAFGQVQEERSKPKERGLAK
jgi:hypothetical protein